MQKLQPVYQIRRVDDLGRVVIPKAVRERLGIREGSPLGISLDEKAKTIILAPYAEKDSALNLLNTLEEKVANDIGREIGEELFTAFGTLRQQLKMSYERKEE